jgi:K+-sensing histidine kinase KdpD
MRSRAKEQTKMTNKTIGWTILCGCLVAVAFAVIAGRASTPPAARAASSPEAPSPFQATQACQAVADRLVTIQKSILNEKRAGELKGLAPLDQLVSQEFQIDTSQCPADFSIAMLRLVMVEDATRIHMHMDRTGKTEALCAAIFPGLVTPIAAITGAKSLLAYNQKIADEQKRDFANVQSALLNLASVSMKYGVK